MCVLNVIEENWEVVEGTMELLQESNVMLGDDRQSELGSLLTFANEGWGQAPFTEG